MKRRVWIAVIIAAALATAAAIFWLQRLKGDYLPASLKIEWQDNDPETALGESMSVNTDGTVYVVEQTNRKYFYRALSRRGATLWRIEAHPDPAGAGADLVLLPGQHYGHLNCVNWPSNTPGRIRLVTVNRDGKLSSTLLNKSLRYYVWLYSVDLTPAGLYAVGNTVSEGAVAARFAGHGGQSWVRCLRSTWMAINLKPWTAPAIDRNARF